MGLSAAALDKLGRPSTPILTRLGTVTQVRGSNLVDNNFDVCGILKVETSDTWAPSYHWVVPGGFGIAQMSFTKTVAANDEPRPDANRELLAIWASCR